MRARFGSSAGNSVVLVVLSQLTPEEEEHAPRALLSVTELCCTVLAARVFFVKSGEEGRASDARPRARTKSGSQCFS